MADKFLDKTGLAYFWEKIKAYFQSQHITPPEYTIVRLANEEVGYAASYVLKKDGTQVGATINIPKDYLVRSGEVKTVTVADEPYEGAVVGDKYLDFVVNTVDDSGNTSHIYIPVSDLVDAYIAGNGIHISDNNYISVKVSQQGVDHGLGVGGDGLTVRMVTPSINGVGGTHGAMYAADKEKLDKLEIVGVFTTGSDTEPPVEGNDGLVPAPTWAERLKFLRGDGTWAEPDGGGGTPNVGNLKTNNTSALTPSASEPFTGDINLHKVSKTGSYNDLNDKPTIPSSGDFVTSLGTSGNNVTWTKNGTTNNITVPYATRAERLNVTSTDNAVVRFDGTGGDIQNSGVTINDSNHITAAKFITIGGTSSKFVKGDGSLDSNTYSTRDKAVHGGDFITNDSSSNTGTTKKSVYINNINDRLYSANKRFYVTHKVFNASTDSFVRELSTDIFKGDTEIYSNIIEASEYAVLYIGAEPEDTIGTNNKNLWVYGSEVVYLTFYPNRYPDSITEAELYAKIEPRGWFNCTITKISTAVYKINLPGKTYPAAIRIKWSGSSSRQVSLSDVKAFAGRSTLITESIVTKYPIKQDFWGDVEAPKFIKRDGTSSQFLKADGSVDSNTYATTSQLPSLPLSIANGGTGATTAKAAEYAISGGMTEGVGLPEDTYKFVFSYINPSSTNGVFIYRTAATIWSWIKNKISSVLGIGGSNGVPTAPTAAAGTNTTQIATTAFVNTATSGFANDTDVVHKANAETITGEKTFNGGAMFGVGSQLKFETAQDEGAYIEAGDDNGVKTLMFADIEDDSAVRLENIANPSAGTDAANKAYVDSKGDNNLVKLNGRSGQYGVTPRSLCAFAISTSAILEIIEPFTTTGGINGKPVRQGVTFPIGCKIYYHPDYNDISANTDFTSKEFYATYDEVDARYTAVTGQNISLYSSSQSGVYLRVNVDNGYWSPYYKPNNTTEIIVTPHDFQTGNFYIYLGKTVGSTGYKFQLEDNNPLYYYDGTKLIDWATYQASEAAPSYTAGDGISISNGVISCTPRPYKKEVFTAVSFNASSAYQKGWQNFVASSNLEVGTYKVTLQVHLYIVSNTDNMMPADCVVNVCMRNKVTSNGTYNYIFGATETLGGGTLPETAITTGRGIISRTLNVVGFMEVTGDEDSSCSLEAIFTTNSSLNVLIGNPVPRDGTYDSICSGNDFVLLEKIA